jgi:hypothetical protein
MKQVASRACFACFELVSCLAYSSTLKMEAKFPLKRWLTFNSLHGVISQKIEFFITTAVRTSNPTWKLTVYNSYKLIHSFIHSIDRWAYSVSNHGSLDLRTALAVLVLQNLFRDAVVFHHLYICWPLFSVSYYFFRNAKTVTCIVYLQS